tara:strand:- start:32 stop:763 length:732 start_codon:yes stop_codon:yes gene_type:complete
MIDLAKRSVSKAVSWKMLGFLVLSSIIYFATGSLKEAGSVAVLYHFLMLVLFVAHERVWNKITWGKTKGLYIQMTGMSGAGKTTLARSIEKKLKERGIKIEIIDGDEYRENLCKDLGFSRDDREENIKRLSFVGKVLGRNNVVCIMSAINPYNSTREHVRKKIVDSKLVYIKCGIEELKKRDTKGLYRRALLPDENPDKVYNFTGISDPFDEPHNPDLVIDTEKLTLEKSVKLFENFIMKHID